MEIASHNNQKGNILIFAIVASSLLLGASISISFATSKSFANSNNIASSYQATYEAEGNLEEALYIWGGHELGFEETSDGDTNKACQLNGDDTWCLKNKIENISGQIVENDFVSIGLYNDISPAYSASNVKNIVPAPNDGTDFEIQLYAEEDSAAYENTVSQGDIRATPIITNTDTYSQNTEVNQEDSDIGNSLSNLKNFSNYLITGSDEIWSEGEYIYIDVDSSKTVTPSDVRVSQYGNFAPNTIVNAGSSDYTSPAQKLYTPQNLGVIVGSNPAKVYATDVLTLSINATVKNTSSQDVLETWTITLSKNDLKSKTASDPLSITPSSKENTIIVGTSQRTLEEFFDDAHDWDSSIWSYTGNNFIEQPILKITTTDHPIYYNVQSPEDNTSNLESKITHTETTLTATTQSKSSKRTFEIVINNDKQIIPIFGSADIIN